jgi:hypothetical protein
VSHQCLALSIILQFSLDKSFTSSLVSFCHYDRYLRKGQKEERFLLAHSFRHFSPWSPCSFAFGLVHGQTENHDREHVVGSRVKQVAEGPRGRVQDIIHPSKAYHQ